MRNILNKITTLSIGLLMVIFFGSFTQSQIKTNYSLEKKPVRILFKADTIYVTNKFKTLFINQIKSEKLRSIFQAFGIKEIKPVLKNRYDLTGQLKNKFRNNDRDCWFVISCEQKDTYSFIKKLNATNEIIKSNIEKSIIVPCKTTYDYSFGYHQWFLTRDNGVNVEDAWTINKGRNDVIIAVCDGGVDYTHPNLDPGDRSRVIAGYDFGSNDNDPMDDLPIYTKESFGNHGTHVAGIIGAYPTATYNISGVMQNCKIMPVKVVGSGGIKIPFTEVYAWDFSTTAFPSDIADGIDYAVNNGAHVINLSIGFSLPGIPLEDAISGLDVLVSSINNAYNQNVVIVAAMGNEGDKGSPLQYPAVLSHVIAVGNTDENRKRSLNSSIGSHICVSAPGSNILSTIRGDTTKIMNGTSMATPVVCGVAGLIISQGKDRGFNLTNDDVRHILEKTADDVLPMGFDNETGYGIVNAYSALQLLSLPNNLIHGIATGGTSNKISTLSKWGLTGPCQGLAAGIYFGVDQYEINKHITFDTPYMSPPVVWFRERESLSLSFASINDGRPFVSITNITNTGFDLRYSVYFVRTNSIGQSINKWIPETLISTKVAYTVVGFPAPIISGPTQGCPGEDISFTISNLPVGATVEWIPNSHLNRVSPQGSNPCIFRSAEVYSGSISASVIIGGTTTNLTHEVNIGRGYYNSSDFSIQVYETISGHIVNPQGPECLCANQTYDIVVVNNGYTQVSNYNWIVPSYWTVNSSSDNTIQINTGSNTEGNVEVSATNPCGYEEIIATTYLLPGFYCNGGYSLSPNPASDAVTISMNQPVTTTASTIAPTSIDTKKETTIYSVKVVDSFSAIVYTGIKKSKQFTISTAALRNGIYTIIVSDGNKSYQRKLVVQH